MRFNRRQRFAFQDTPRKRAMLLRKQAAERNSMPLFADQIAAEQPHADDVMRSRAESAARSEQEWRARRAADWRRGRARLAAYPDHIKRALLAYWQSCQWPADPGYLISMLHMYDNDRLTAIPRNAEAHREGMIGSDRDSNSSHPRIDREGCSHAVLA